LTVKAYKLQLKNIRIAPVDLDDASNEMLLQRVITALVLAPLVVGAVYLLSHVWFAALVAVVFGLASYEWAGLCGWTRMVSKLAYVGVFLLASAIAFQLPLLHLSFLYFGCALWLMAITAVLLHPKGKQLFNNRLFLAPLGLTILLVAWTAIVQIHQHYDGSHWLGWMLVLVWAADVGAYFAGKMFGKHKLAPQVSPGKTWEGAGGGFVLSLILCGGLILWWQADGVLWLVVTAVLIVISVFGDLFESLLKRSTGIKDSGTILPGHGGMLDRIDSLVAVVPFLGVVLAVTGT
jgi:phosphatidate cytidylyltransferase